ncbi:hypothetical protein T439DRAFT_378012 [Meredithblackwellia eburnea MCA 4105]
MTPRYRSRLPLSLSTQRLSAVIVHSSCSGKDPALPTRNQTIHSTLLRNLACSCRMGKRMDVRVYATSDAPRTLISF